MNNLFLKRREDDYLYPGVSLDADTGVCEISGESYLENPEEYYAPLFKWVKNYASEKKGPLAFHFKLTYFNTSSSRCILELLQEIKAFQNAGGDVSVFWHCGAGDIDMVEDVEDFVTGTGLDIKIMDLESEL